MTLVMAFAPSNNSLGFSRSPRLEHWATRLTWLPREARERIDGGAFYERLLEVVRALWQTLT